MPKLSRLALCGLLLATTARPQSARAAPGQGPAGDWGPARWGMSVEEILSAFPGRAKRIEPAIQLRDGNAVAAGIDGHVVATVEFQVRFVFAGGKLGLVSLRTPASRYAGPEVFEKVRQELVSELGPPASSESDGSFIDMRQARWNVLSNQVDLKFIPGVVVILYHPRSPAGDGDDR